MYIALVSFIMVCSCLDDQLLCAWIVKLPTIWSLYRLFDDEIQLFILRTIKGLYITITKCEHSFMFKQATHYINMLTLNIMICVNCYYVFWKIYISSSWRAVRCLHMCQWLKMLNGGRYIKLQIGRLLVYTVSHFLHQTFWIYLTTSIGDSTNQKPKWSF